MMNLSTLAAFFLAAHCVAGDIVTGDLKIFCFSRLSNPWSSRIQWPPSTEGPVLIKNDIGDDEVLFFSDNNVARIYSVDLHEAIQDLEQGKTNSARCKHSWQTFACCEGE
mmetsp:Transcript_31739/g.53727  ORF Transcript_31739/g.53727 Transcript_31739/m.53727 type:complete len:110 (-) Transcript_31739:889-1218(-)